MRRGGAVTALRVLLTGGAGYVGSHVLVELLQAGYSVTVLDNLVTGDEAMLAAVRSLTGRDFAFRRIDICDAAATSATIAVAAPDAAIHCAGLKSPSESFLRPQDYHDVNVTGTRRLLDALAAVGCRRLVFSSSAAIYGPPERLPIPEDHPLRPATPYGATKRAAETALRDAAHDRRWSVAMLRYFNPAGAHESGLIGEAPKAAPANLMPNLVAVAAGERATLTVYGADWPTPDGTGVRDYLHVVDLARAHLAALDWTGRATGARAFNLGTGLGVSVRELATALAAASGRAVPLEIAPRRIGDVASAFADVTLAANVLGWRTERGVAEICASAWAWRMRNLGRADPPVSAETPSSPAGIAGT